jgi:exopolysaccharide production protein ExoQ
VVATRGASQVPSFVRNNRWLVAFYVYLLLTVLWSDFPFVAFKRWFKEFGNVVMVLVLLCERDPVQAVKSVFVRCAYVLVPLSVLFIRYVPSLGRTYSGYSQNELMYVGVATHKNTLGALLLVSIIFLAWNLARNRVAAVPSRKQRAGSLLVLLFALWLLSLANSATAIVCTVVGLGLLTASRFEKIRRSFRHLELIVLAGAGMWFVLDPIFNIAETIVVSGLGRDMTLTTRTSAWDLLLNSDVNPLIGAGFQSFWAGERMAKLWQTLPGIIQAHNGYIELYLEGGIVAVVLLVGLLVTSFRSVKRRMVNGDEFARVQLTFWFIAIIYNFSEAAITQRSLMWIVTLVAITRGLESPSGEVVPVITPPNVSVGVRRRAGEHHPRYAGTWKSPAQRSVKSG